MTEQRDQVGTPGRGARERVVLRPDRITYFPVMVCFLGALPLALTAPWLTWVLLLPLAWGTWVARARVVAEGAGLEVCNGLAVHRTAWSDVEGFDVQRRGRVRLLRRDAGPLRLTTLTRRDLPAVLAVGRSSGPARPDPGAAGTTGGS
jgi:hypothetical protein